MTLVTFHCREKVFADKCNKESVALESVVDAEDLNGLRQILQEFMEKTGSKVAENILRDWPAAAGDFVKVSDRCRTVIYPALARI